MKRTNLSIVGGAAFLAASAVVFLGACSSDPSGSSGSGAKIHCAKTSMGCRCASQPFTLTAAETPTDSCDPSGGATCCHDLSSDGTTTSCSCVTYHCFKTATDCRCTYWGAYDAFDKIPDGATEVPSCAPSGTFNECASGLSTTGQLNPINCECLHNSTAGVSTVPCPPRTSATDSAYCNSGHVGSTCSGLTWR